MASPLKRNAEEILEALEAASMKFKRAFRERSEKNGDKVRQDVNTSRDTDQDMTTRQQELTSGQIHELDVGRYGSQRYRDQDSRGDGIEHDHIPSTAALLEARRRELDRDLTPDERREVIDNAVTVSIRRDLHLQSRTHSGHNTPAQIAQDAGDLSDAIKRDLAVLARNLLATGEYDAGSVAAVIQTIRELNGLMGR